MPGIQLNLCNSREENMNPWKFKELMTKNGLQSPYIFARRAGKYLYLRLY